MPFDPDNPPAKLKNLSDKKKRQWVHVFNSCYEKHKDDKMCHMQAWGVVKKSAAESLADIVKQIPEKVALIEEMFGMRWNDDDEKFDALSYPDIPRSEVDRVDNAPGGLTASGCTSADEGYIIRELIIATREIRAALRCQRLGQDKRTARTTRA